MHMTMYENNTHKKEEKKRKQKQNQVESERETPNEQKKINRILHSISVNAKRATAE